MELTGILQNQIKPVAYCLLLPSCMIRRKDVSVNSGKMLYLPIERVVRSLTGII